MKRFVVLFTMLGMLAALAHAGVITAGSFTADALNPAPAGTTFPPGPGGLVGGIGGPIPFVLPSAGGVSITVDDCCIVGDVYEVLVDGLSLGWTSPVPLGGPTLSTGTWMLALGAGAHSLDIWDIPLSYIGAASPFGGGIVPLNYSPAGGSYLVQTAGVPEPSTCLLFGAGLLGLLGLRRRRA
jgi:hypothetical protein